MKLTLHLIRYPVLPLVLAAVTANAQNFSPTGPALGFNVFTKAGVTFTAGDSHGAVATGGNLTLNGSTIIAMQSSGTYPNGTGNSNTNYGLVVGGTVNFQSGNVSYVNNGTMRIGNLSGVVLYDHDNNNATTNLQATSGVFNSNPRVQLQQYQPAAPVNTANGIAFNQAFVDFAGYSTVINQYDTDPYYAADVNVITIPAGMNPHITLANNKINVIRLSGAQLTALYNQGSFIFDNQPSASRPLIFNIEASGTYNWYPPNIGGIGENVSAYMLWNWIGTTQLNIVGSNSTYGTLLAPEANINKTAGNNTNGQVIANSLIIAYGEIHNFPFQGTDPNTGTPTFPRKPAVLSVSGLTLSGLVAKDGQPLLNWTALGVQDVNHYQIQRSANGVDFCTIATKSSAGTITTESFDYTDAAATDGQFLYRISAVSEDGTVDYSNTIVIDTRSQGSHAVDVTLTGNPVAANYHLQVMCAQPTGLAINVFSSNGTRVMPSRTMQASAGTTSLPLSDMATLPSGLYILDVQATNGSYHKSLQFAR